MKKYLLLLLTFCMSLISCNKEEEPNFKKEQGTSEINQPYIKLTLNKNIGEKIKLGINAYENQSDIWIDLNDNKKRDKNEEIKNFGINFFEDTSNLNEYIIQNKVIYIYGNVDRLFCENNQITNIFVSKENILTSLYCANNKIIGLDVSRCDKLNELWCDNNLIEKLDVSNNLKLRYLNCSQNKLKYLDVKNNYNLTTFYCEDNSIENLDVSKNIKLNDLRCSENKLTLLNVENNKYLDLFFCDNNKIKELNLTNNTRITHLRCNDNQMEKLDISNILNLTDFLCYNNLFNCVKVRKEQLNNQWYSNNNVSYDVNCN